MSRRSQPFDFPRFHAMGLLTILNRCHCFRGFVYRHAVANESRTGEGVANHPLAPSYASTSALIVPHGSEGGRPVLTPYRDSIARSAKSASPAGRAKSYPAVRYQDTSRGGKS